VFSKGLRFSLGPRIPAAALRTVHIAPTNKESNVVRPPHCDAGAAIRARPVRNAEFLRWDYTLSAYEMQATGLSMHRTPADGIVDHFVCQQAEEIRLASTSSNGRLLRKHGGTCDAQEC
jgi:hypothetical protein